MARIQFQPSSTSPGGPIVYLQRYEQVKRALADALQVDEVLAIRNQAEAMRAYAVQAKDRDLETQAAEFRIRAERRLGEMIAQQKETIGLNAGRAGRGRPSLGGDTEAPPKDTRPTLSDIGVDKKLSQRAQRMAAVPEAEFEGMLDTWRSRIAVENERVTVNLLRAGEKRMSRDEREKALADKIKALPGKRYGFILCDNEWRFEPRSRETGMDRAADNHYPTSDLETLMARDVASIAAPDCILGMWVPVPMLIEGFCVADAWGFCRLDRNPETGFLSIDRSQSRYVTGWDWLKTRIITGYWNRGKHEHLLLFRRGNPVAPEFGTQLASWFEGFAHEAAQTEHSAKPEIFQEWIEQLWPNTPKIEMNRRGEARPGWDAWGLEAA